MLFSMVSTLFQSTMGAEFVGNTNEDFVIPCLYALVRVVLLSATFVLGQRAFKARNNKKPCGLRITKGSPQARGRHAKKLSVYPPSDDEDDLSTSVGSSDSESDMLSSDNEDDTRKSTKISIADLLQCRPAVGPAQLGSLRAMPVNERVTVSRQQFEERRWGNLRGVDGAQQPSAPAIGASRPSKTAPTKQSSKTAPASATKLKAAPLPKKVACVAVDAATVAANAARMQALLEIICPEDVPVVHKEKAKGALPPWRQPAVATMPLSLPPGLEVN